MNLPALALPAILLWSCGPKYECGEDQPCDFGEQCVAGFCTEPQCSSSQQCPIDHFCRGRECIPGCQNDGDCRTGYSCDQELSECVVDECVDTHVDCGFREFCNVATGDCYDAGEQYCKPCRTSTEAEDCGAGNECLNGYCGRACETSSDCPGGFECYPFENAQGQVVTYQCFTYCWLYEDYEPGALVAPPASVTGPLPLDLKQSDLPTPEGL